MSYSFKLTNIKYQKSNACYIKRNDGIWKDSPYFLMERTALNYIEKIKDFEIYPDDIWLTGYYKTGTTWAKELIWLLNNDLNYQRAKTEILSHRFPFFDNFTGAHLQDKKLYENLCSLQRPRHLKTHHSTPFLPDQIWEKKPKIVHLSRNPLDVAVSYHHWQKISSYIESANENLEETLDQFMNDESYNAPFIEHTTMFWDLEKQGYPNILFITYEDMVNDMPSVIERAQKFLGKSYSKDQLKELEDHLSFDRMKKNNAVNHSEKAKKDLADNTQFMRKGKIGSYKEEMSPEYIEKMNAWLKRNLENKEHRFNLF